MQIHEIIRTRRTALGLTQEQLAGKLGVSAPAVNKWERGNSYPDITLLPVLARTLRVDLNTLLSFQEDLTETEIAEFLNRLYEVSRTEGCGAAFSLAEEKLRQFPNSDALAYSAAGLLEGLLTLFPGTDETARPGREDFVAGLYEQAAQSADPKIREWATYTVASRCIARGDLDRAEALLDQISNTHRDKRELLSALRRMRLSGSAGGRTRRAAVLHSLRTVREKEKAEGRKSFRFHASQPNRASPLLKPRPGWKSNFTAPTATSGPTARWMRAMPSLPKPAHSSIAVTPPAASSFAAASASA